MTGLTTSNPGPLSRELDALGTEEILAEQARIEGFLSSRFVLVRYSAASALGRAEIGGAALLSRLRVERNDLVASEICTALGEIADGASVPLLREVASSSSSPLVRAEAVLALVEIEGGAVVSYLIELVHRDRSRGVLATPGVCLYALGKADYRVLVQKALRSRDYRVRCRAANLLVSFLRCLPDTSLQEDLEVALAAERTRAARGDLEKAVEAFRSVSMRSRREA